jgi:hypothetical protein
MIRFERHPEIAVTGAEWASGGFREHYTNDYEAIFRDVAAGKLAERDVLRSLFVNDLWFLIRFGFGIEKANHPFVVRMCREVERGPRTDTLDIWARFHWKSTIITQAETLQFQIKNPDKCTGIFCYARPAAKKPLRSLKVLLEESELLQWCFPEVLWKRPDVEAPKWSEDDGLILKRSNSSRKESSIEAHGLIEGMPTGSHFERNVFDDLETEDIRESPDMLAKVFSKFQMAQVNLATGSDSDQTRVIGTYYSYYGPNIQIRDLKYPDGRQMYRLRLVPGSYDGTKEGKPVLMDVNAWEKAKMSAHFNSQQLCDPTPQSEIKLDFSMMRPIEPKFLPKNRLKFVVVDPAGDDEVTKGTHNDNWAMGCISVEPVMDDLGTSKIFIEDIEYGHMKLDNAVDAAVGLYIRNGRIVGLGVERVGTDTTYEHIRKGLLAKGRHVRIKKSARDGGNLVLLSPDGKKKTRRVESALSWPLNNGKVYYVTSLDSGTLDEIRAECNKFPFFHVDILDMISYVYKLVEEMRFNFSLQEEVDRDDEDLDDKPDYAQGRSAVGGY